MTTNVQVETNQNLNYVRKWSGLYLKTLPTLLRVLGALTLMAAISIYLLQGWKSGNDVYRYLLLLGHTVILAAVGFASGHLLRESKGARLLLIIALASVPANFAIMGAFIFSTFSLDVAGIIYPDYARWFVDDFYTALIITCGASVVLLPVIWLGFMVLTRSAALRFSGLFLLTNAALLIPVRSPLYVGVMLVVLVPVVFLQVTQAVRKDTALKTPEGIIARALLIMPLGYLFGRNLWLYAADDFLFTLLSGMVFLGLRQVALQLNRDSKVRAYLDRSSVLAAAAVAVGVYAVLGQFVGVRDYLLPLVAIIFAGLVIEISVRTANGGAGYRRLAAIVVTIAVLLNLIIHGGVFMAAICVSVGLLLLIYGYMVEQRLIFAAGLLTLITGFIYQISFAIHMFDLGSWASLAGLGISAILIGSALERYGSVIKVRLTGWGKQIRSWDN